MQMSIHVKVVGLSLASRATFQLGLLEKRLLGRYPVGNEKER
jgi:hypothetical protein